MKLEFVLFKLTIRKIFLIVMKAGFHKNYVSANTDGNFERREVDAQEGPIRGRSSMQSNKENVNLVIDTMGVALEQNRCQVISGGAVGRPSKGGAVTVSVAKTITMGDAVTVSTAKAGTVALSTWKLTHAFEVIIYELDQAIQSEPIISNSKSIRVE